MQKSYNLLVCLSPAIATETLGEHSFYSIINPIAPVLNLKLISREGQFKAFVEVENKLKADLIISKLHDQILNIGKIKVFVSHKQNICYDRTLDELLFNFGGRNQVNGLKNKSEFLSLSLPSRESANGYTDLIKMLESNNQCRGLNDAKRENRNSDFDDLPTGVPDSKNLDFRNDVLNEGLVMERTTPVTSKIDLNHSGISQVNLTSGNIKVTHDNITTQTHNKVIRIFRRFGRVYELNLNADKLFWEVQYRSEKNAIKALKAMHNDRLFGYRHYKANEHAPGHQLINKEPKLNTINKETRNQSSYNSNINNTDIGKQLTSLTIITYKNVRTLEDVCKIVSAIHVPFRLMEAIDPKNDKQVYVAEFEYCYQAAEVLVSLSINNYVNKVFM